MMNIETYITKQLKPGEEIVRIVHRYRAVLVPPLVGASLLVLLDFFMLAWWFRQGSWGVGGFIITAAVAVWWGIRAWYIWAMNVFAITNQRIIDVDQRGLFERHVAEAGLDKIQDVRYSVRGVWQTMLSLGAIVVQTAGSSTNLELNHVHRPVEIQQLITDLQKDLTPTNEETTA